MLRIDIEELNAGSVCRVHGELDAGTVGVFREQLSQLNGVRMLVLDLCGVPFLDSAGLGAMIGAIRRLRDNGGDVAIACNRPALRRLLHTTGLDRIVAIDDSAELAMTAMCVAEAGSAKA